MRSYFRVRCVTAWSLMTLSLGLIGMGCNKPTEERSTTRTSAFVGTWKGSFATAASNGSLQLDIKEDGTVAGVVSNITTNETGPLNAKIANGEMKGNFRLGKQAFTFNGKVEVTSAGRFKGLISNFRDGKQISQAMLDLAKG